MKPAKLSIVILCASALLVVLLAACPNPISPAKGSSLTVSINNNINARTLLPAIDMNAASFTVSGTGPGTATFSQTTTGAPVTLDGLAFGAWSVTVNALNSAGTLIGSGQTTVTVHTAQTATVNITVVPLTGNGTLDLTVSWTASQVENASILASLTPPVGPSTPLSFSVTGNTATYSSTTIPAGYQTLTVQLLDSGIPVMGAVDVVRIVAGQTTSGTYAFTNVNQPGGSVQVNITPAMAEPIPVSISGVPATVSAGGSMTATASVSDGTANVAYVWYLNGVSVGMGVTYALGSTVPAGYYRLDVTVYAADGTRAGSATASFQVTAASGASKGYVYFVNFGSRNVAASAIGPGGLLTPLSTPTFAAGSNPEAIAATPNGSFLYVTNEGDNTVSGYAIGPDGLLIPLSAPVATGSEPMGIAVTPNGSFAYIANAGTVSAYAVRSSGLLTPLTTPEIAGGPGPLGIAVAPNGSFLYVANNSGNCVSAYTIDSTTGALAAVAGSPFPAAAWGTVSVAINPTSRFVYACNFEGGGSVSAYTIDSSTGALTQMPGSPFGAGTSPYAVAITPNGRYLYTTDTMKDNVSAYAIGAGGFLTPLSTPSYTIGPVGDGWSRQGAAITPDGSFLYVTSNVGVSAYAIGSGGLLTPLGTLNYSDRGTPWGIVVVP